MRAAQQVHALDTRGVTTRYPQNVNRGFTLGESTGVELSRRVTPALYPRTLNRLHSKWIYQLLDEWVKYPSLIGMNVEGATVLALFAPCGAAGKYGRTWTLRCACGNLFQKTTNGIAGKHRARVRCRECSRRAASESALCPANLLHGDSKSYLYTAWAGARRRCYEPEDKQFHNYGGRGIRVDEIWRHDYLAFRGYIVSTLGHRPTPKHSLDRINNEGNYEPGNLRWATQKQQVRNSRRCLKRGLTSVLPPCEDPEGATVVQDVICA